MSDPQSGAQVAGVVVGMLFYAVLILGTVIGMWAAFAKAGKPGWAAIVPIYNLIVLCELAGKPGWWALLCIIPCVNLVFLFLIMMGVAKAFGRDIGTAIGLFLLGFIFWPMLGFGDAKYQGV